MVGSRIRLTVALLSPVLGLVAGCDSTRPPLPGGMMVTVSPSGTDITHSGYSATLDDGQVRSLDPVTSRATFFNLEPRTYTVRLEGLAPNCTVAGQNPMTVTVAEGQTTFAQFNVTCVANTGTVRVTTVTTGSDLDPNGYHVM